jgi:hypothetical protein
MPRFQSILIPVPQAEALVEPFRRTGDWSRAYGVPAHMTIAGPWPLSLELPFRALRNVRAAIAGEQFTLTSAGTLGDAICLFPENDRALMRWRKRILDAVGDVDQVNEEWRMHLTVCRTSRQGTIGAIEQAVAKALPVNCEVRGLLLAQMHGDSRVTVKPL